MVEYIEKEIKRIITEYDAIYTKEEIEIMLLDYKDELEKELENFRQDEKILKLLLKHYNIKK